MTKKKRKKQKSKASKKQSVGLLGMIDQMKGLTSYTGQKGFRAQIIDTNIGTQKGHQPPLKEASHMGGKKLVMTGKDKGKII